MVYVVFIKPRGCMIKSPPLFSGGTEVVLTSQNMSTERSRWNIFESPAFALAPRIFADIIEEGH